MLDQNKNKDELLLDVQQLRQRLNELVKLKTLELTDSNKKLAHKVIELEQTETALRESEERYRRLIELTPDAVIVYIKYEIVFINPAGLHLLGAGEPNEIIGNSILEFLQSNFYTDQTSIVNRNLDLEYQLPVMEEKLTRLDKKEIDVEVIRIPFSYQDNFAVQLIIRDVTDRKKTEKALRESQEISQILLNAPGEGAVLIDVNGKIFAINMTAAVRFKKNIPDLIAKCIYDFIEADLLDSRKMAAAKVIKSGKACFLEETRENQYFSLTIYPVFDIGKEVTRLAIFEKNITEKKKLEEEMIRREKLESLGIVAGGIAHNFNNILMAIMSQIYIARLKSSLLQDKEMVQILKKAEIMIFQAKNLSEQLVTYSKGGSFFIETVDISQLLKETVSFSLAGSKVKYHFSISNDLWAVEIDYNQMTQVINNIVINARETMPEGGLIEVKAINTLNENNQLLSSEKNFVQISIQDQGPGIAKEHYSKIFDPYFTTKANGTGLGLATSYSIINRHGGFITVDSEIGLGSCFHIYLPASLEKPLIKRKKPLESVEICDKVKLLILDDDERILTNIGEILKGLGYEVELCQDGIEAVMLYQLEKKSGKGFDVILLDLTIPGGMGGMETLAALNQTDSGVKAIAVSGYFKDPAITHFKDYGFKAVVTKPYSIAELQNVINSVMK